jgi:hypothetical protein
MREQVWAILGSVPGSHQIVVLDTYHGSKALAEITRDERAEESFKNKRYEAKLCLVDIATPNQSQLRGGLRKYLRELGVWESDLEEHVEKLLLNISVVSKRE